MSNTSQPIQFLLHQLATNEGDLERFNQVSEVKAYISIINDKLCFEDEFVDDFFYLLNLSKKEIIRTCLSRVNGQAVLDAMDKIAITFEFKGYRSVVLYEYFDYELRNGKPLDQSIQALHDKMFELVPEYREFLNNEK